jgi:hypothetical protein
MDIVQIIRFYWNKKKLIDICKYHIDRYELQNPRITTPTCKYYLLQEIKRRIDNDKENIAELNHGTNWLKLAHANLADASFDLLVSGQFHSYYGELNTMSCSGNLRFVYSCSMKWAVENHFISQEEYDEQIDYLYQCINEIG